MGTLEINDTDPVFKELRLLVEMTDAHLDVLFLL
jgi:hypothetical protein